MAPVQTASCPLCLNRVSHDSTGVDTS
jgi:hypothetical protein